MLLIPSNQLKSRRHSGKGNQGGQGERAEQRTVPTGAAWQNGADHPDRLQHLSCGNRREIELGKELRGDRIDSWIQLFNAESGEELDMLAAKYKGLAEAAEIMKRMSLGKMLRYQYEAHLKAVRDRRGEDEYVRDQGRAEGINVGRAEGITIGKAEDILQLLSDLGEIPDGLRDRIQKETDLQVLTKWLKAAARAESISDFENKTTDVQQAE